MFGAKISLICDHKQGASVKWYINYDKALDEDIKNSVNESILMLTFTTPGVYRCEVTTNEGNETLAATLCAIGKTLSHSTVELCTRIATYVLSSLKTI